MLKGVHSLEGTIGIAPEDIDPTDTHLIRPTLFDGVMSRWRFVALVQVFDVMGFIVLSFAWFHVLKQTPAGGNSWWSNCALAICVPIVMHCVFRCFRLYEFPILTKAVESTARAFCAAIILIGCLVVPFLVLSDSRDAVMWTASGLLAESLCGILVSRIALASLGQWLRQTGGTDLRVCIIADSEAAAASLRRMLQALENIRVVGTCALTPSPIRASLEEALVFLRQVPTDIVILNMPLSEPDCLLEATEVLRGFPRTTLLAPRFQGLENIVILQPSFNAARLENLFLFKLSERPLFGWRWVVKDLQDKFLALILILITLPVFLLIAISIKLSDPGPVFFRQKRYGYRGRTFDIIKFRTMRGADLAKLPHSLRLTMRDDPRIFPVGRILRQSSLDELPQLLNVLRGDMWIVGPRPHSPFAEAGGTIYAKAVRDYMGRYRIKPGITGWAQVCGWRGPTETLEQLRKRVEHDLYYIEHWSVLFDARILIRTLLCVFGAENAF
jgi:exopolysaccharide biosynthesis polyprenyl glycosylphosphotransferase